MAENERVHEPGRVGPVAEGQLELNRRLVQASPEASREQLHEAQDALVRDRPEAVHEAAAGQPTAQQAAREARAEAGQAEAAEPEGTPAP